MVKEMNNAYINPTNQWLPAYRQGALGDAQKVNCATCHQGAYQPLLGANMIADYPSLSRLAPAEEPAEVMDEAVEKGAAKEKQLTPRSEERAKAVEAAERRSEEYLSTWFG